MLEYGDNSRVNTGQANRDFLSTGEKSDQPDDWSLFLWGDYAIVLAPTRVSGGYSGHPLLWMRW